MSLIAGVDIGNTTTEIVLAELRAGVAVPVRRGSVLTAGRKGSARSVAGAWRLLERLEAAAAVRCSEILVGSYEPVSTGIRTFAAGSTGSARLIPLDAAAAFTPFGRGFAAGRPVPLSDLDGVTGRGPRRKTPAPVPPDGRSPAGVPPGTGSPAGPPPDPVVAVVPAGVDFAAAAERINVAVRRGVGVVGVLAAGDDAVLIGHRLSLPLPIVDEIDVQAVATADVVLLEVAAASHPLRTLADPLALRAALDAALGDGGLESVGLHEIEAIARRYVDGRCGAIACRGRARDVEADTLAGAWVEHVDAGGRRQRSPIAGELQRLARTILPGAVRAVFLPGSGEEPASDLYVPDLPGLLARPVVRRGSVVVQEAPAAVLGSGVGREDARALLEDLSRRPVIVAATEAQAARRGALTTPGAPAAAAVCDIGGGTIDLVGNGAAITAAGAGELLTLSVVMAAGIPRSIAERVKRYRSFRVESPRLVHDEDGARRFVSGAEYGRHVGRLCVDGGRGILPFHQRLSPEEWRILRLTLKEEVLGANVRRALRALGTTPAELILCGGCALDDELVRVVADSLRAEHVLVGRANVGGSLGPRYAVALGLVLARAGASA